MSAGPELVPLATTSTIFDGPSAISHLLHALNQPLTGLQCSLELATAGPRSTAQYLRTLHDGLELTSRMRILVEALRELADVERGPRKTTTVALDAAVADVVTQLHPVAESSGVHLDMEIRQTPLWTVSPPGISNLLFRLGAAILSLAQPGECRIVVSQQNDQACASLAWTPGSPPEHSPFSRAELGLLVAQAGFQKAGWDCRVARDGERHSCTLLSPFVSSSTRARRDQAERTDRRDFE